MASFRNLVARLIRWGSTSGSLQDGGALPVQQVSYLGKRAKAAPWFPYGMHANVPTGTLGVLLALLGVSEMRLFLPGSPARRPKTLASGEVVYYHPETGSRIHFLASGAIRITAGSATALLDPSGAITLTPAGGQAVTVAGNLVVSGTTALGASVTSAGVNIGSTHAHSGVTTGAGTSGPPV